MTQGPRVIDLRGVPPPEADLGEAVLHVRAGGILAYPTETVYGFGGVCEPAVIERVRGLKARDADKPLLVLVPGASAASDLAWSDEARELAGLFWPGALTLVLPDPRATFPAGVRSSSGAVAVRVSPHPLVARLLDAVGEPLTSTSANVASEPPARSGAEAAAAAARGGPAGDVLVLEAGTLVASLPSTVVDCTVSPPVVLRRGSVPVERLRCALPEIHGR